MITLVQQYFSRSAQRFPHKVAVACKDQTLTFGELDATTNAYARRLRALGVSGGVFVPFFMKKSVGSIKAILSILKADGAYVPLDVGSPPHRLREILKSAGARWVVVDTEGERQFRALFADELPVQLVNIDEPPDADTGPIAYGNISIDIAYVLFTSGSTGKPKGVMISHQMIIDYIEWCVETYRLTDADVIANHAPLYFDNSTFDLYTAFHTGATLQLVHDELNVFLSKLIPWLQKREVTVLFCVPSVMTILLKSGRLMADSFPRLRHVIAAGEVLPPEVLRPWMERYPHIQFTNMYGPTEITVDCTFHVQASIPDNDVTTIPIGRARDNMQVFLRLDDGTLTTQPGAVGEIVVRGRSVAYGYLNDPERTRLAFIQNPRHALYHDPIYCTGDLARIAEDGSFLFIGRRDHQIKYMGNRIELGEIEAALHRLDCVSEAVVVFNDSQVAEEKCIGALVCLGVDTPKEDIVAQLQRELPAYMVPRKLVLTDALPRTPNGKADRADAYTQVFGNK